MWACGMTKGLLLGLLLLMTNAGGRVSSTAAEATLCPHPEKYDGHMIVRFRPHTSEDRKHVAAGESVRGLKAAATSSGATNKLLGLSISSNSQQLEAPALPTVLALTILKDGYSWGEGRTIFSYLDMIQSFNYSKSRISVAILISDLSYFNLVITSLCASFRNYGFHQATIVHRLVVIPGLPLSGAKRHPSHLDKERRSLLARLRNFLMYSTLESEDGVLWLDSDVIEVPAGGLQKV